MNEHEIAHKELNDLVHSDVLPHQILCPSCGLHMTYVGMQQQDLQEVYKVADQQYWKRMHKMAGVEGATQITVPVGYKCNFCEVQPLSTSKETWRLPFGHFSESDKANAKVRETILKRDKYTCCDCQIRLPRHMEVRHLDEDHSNHDPSNLACVCPFCHMRDHLGPTGFAQAAHVIGNSRLSQAQINSTILMCWYIMDRIVDDEDIRVTKDQDEQEELGLLRAAIQLTNDLYTYGIRWTDSFNKGASDPFTFGSILTKFRYEVIEEEPGAIAGAKAISRVKEVLLEASAQTDAYRTRNIKFSALSLLPRREAFLPQCKDWFDYLDKNRPVNAWAKGFNSMLGRNDLNSADQLFKLIASWNKQVSVERAGTYSPVLPPRTRSKMTEDQEPLTAVENHDEIKAPLNTDETSAPVVAAAVVAAEMSLKTTLDAKKDQALASASTPSEKAHTDRSDGSILKADTSEKMASAISEPAQSSSTVSEAVSQVDLNTPSLFAEDDQAISASAVAATPSVDSNTPSLFAEDDQAISASAVAATPSVDSNTPSLFAEDDHDIPVSAVAAIPSVDSNTPSLFSDEADPLPVNETAVSEAAGATKAWGAWGEKASSEVEETEDAQESNEPGDEFIDPADYQDLSQEEEIDDDDSTGGDVNVRF